jgi:hypothetical protein
MPNLNKKGLAETVVTISLIAITLIAVFLSVGNMVKIFAAKSNIQISPEFNCIQTQTALNPELQMTKACRNAQTNKIEITLTRNALSNSQIDSLTFAFDDDSAFSCSDSCGEGICTVPASGETKTYFFSSDNSQNKNSVTLNIEACELDRANILDC